jgi:hypothetical protein
MRLNYNGVMVFYRNDIYRSYNIGDNINVVRADRSPCPVCGHPSGDCVGDTAKPDHIAGFNSIDSLKDSQTFIVEEDIWIDRQLTPTTKTKVLLHAKGKLIPVTEAEKLGLI